MSMEMDVAYSDSRSKKIDDLVAFTEEASTWLETTIKSLEWTKESTFEKPSMTVCPCDPNHYVPQDTLVEHTKYCEWIKKGYSYEEITQALEERSNFPYENSNVVTPVYIDEETYQHILEKTSGHGFGGGGVMKREMPLTIEREVTELSREERLALYNYVVKTAKDMNKKISISQDELMLFGSEKHKDTGPKTHLEMLAAERDLKRRRQSYKGKSVHTSKKSHTEVIRELIANQMELLVPSKDDTDIKEESPDRKDSWRDRDIKEESPDRKGSWRDRDIQEEPSDKRISPDRNDSWRDRNKERDRYSSHDRYSRSSHRYNRRSEEKDELDRIGRTVKIEKGDGANKESSSKRHRKSRSGDRSRNRSRSRSRHRNRSRSRSRESHRHKHKKKKKSKKHKSSRERSSKRDVHSDESDY